MDSVEKGLRELLRASMARTSEVESKLGTLEQNYDLCKAELAGVIADAKTQSLRLGEALKLVDEVRAFYDMQHRDVEPGFTWDGWLKRAALVVETRECECHRATGTGATPWCPVHGETAVERQSFNCSACGKPLDLEHTWCHACASSAYQSE
jgi:hypothetical protein